MARSGITPAAAAGGSSVTVTDTPYDYPEDSGHVTGAPGAFVLAVRNDAGTSLVDTTLDYAPLQVNAAGELRVTTAGGTPTGRDDTDNQAPVATGLATGVSRMYVWDGTAWDRWDRAVTQAGSWTVALDAGTLAALESITVQNGAGAAAVNIQDGGNSITVDGTVAATQSGVWTVTADTELPPAIVLADNMANPTVPQVGAHTMVFDGSTWDRWTGAISGTVELGATTLAALETITVLQGTSPWVVSGTITADTELPPAILLADAMANPTVPQVGAHGMVFNGTTWDRVRSAGVLGTQMVGGAAAHDAPSAGNPVLIGGHAVAESTTITDVTVADVSRILTDLKGRLHSVSRRPQLLGLYHAPTGTFTVTATADAATAGRFWLVNTSATVLVALRRVIMTYASTAATSFLSAPRFQLERMTFTGTPSGATITPAKRDSNDAAHTGSLRTAVTGMTPTAGAAIVGFQIHEVLTAVGAVNPSPQDLFYSEEERIVLRQNQGLVFRQNTAGSATDTRTVQVDIVWEEYTL